MNNNWFSRWAYLFEQNGCVLSFATYSEDKSHVPDRESVTILRAEAVPFNGERAIVRSDYMVLPALRSLHDCESMIVPNMMKNMLGAISVGDP